MCIRDSSTMSPRTPSAGSWPSRPGLSSSIGKLMTSVGPGRSIHCTCRTSIAASSTSLTQRSAWGWTFISPITYLAHATSSISSREKSLSLRTSMLTGVHRLGLVGAPGTRRAGQVVPASVGIHDGRDQVVTHHVMGVQLGEVHVLDAVEDLADDLQPGRCAAGQVDLGHVSGHDHPGAEAQPGEEHLHLLG